MAGVFISKGMTITIPPGGLTFSISEDGKRTGNLTPHIHFDVCPTWLELATRHLKDAKNMQLARVEAWKSSDENAKALSLEREFEASMQAIMAAATSIDAFYAVIKNKAQVNADLYKTWKKNKTARHSQISEVIRISFSIKDKDFTTLRKIIKEIYKYRDAAVHPSGISQEAILHPELELRVEWRFAWFRYENALIIVRETIKLLYELISAGQPQNDKIQKYAGELRPIIQLLIEAIKEE